MGERIVAFWLPAREGGGAAFYATLGAQLTGGRGKGGHGEGAGSRDGGNYRRFNLILPACLRVDRWMSTRCRQPDTNLEPLVLPGELKTN